VARYTRDLAALEMHGAAAYGVVGDAAHAVLRAA